MEFNINWTMFSNVKRHKIESRLTVLSEAAGIVLKSTEIEPYWKRAFFEDTYQNKIRAVSSFEEKTFAAGLYRLMLMMNRLGSRWLVNGPNEYENFWEFSGWTKDLKLEPACSLEFTATATFEKPGSL